MGSLAVLFRPDAPGFWLLADLFLGFVLWVVALPIPPRWQSLSRILRWVALPYIALLLGAISPQAMGLAGLDWQVGLTLGLGIILGVLALLVVVRFAAARDLGAEEADATVAPDDPIGLPALYAVLYHGAQEFHWCFQRAALFAIAIAWPRPLDAPDYWAIWAATLLALPGLITTAPGQPRLYKGIALVASAILFFYTRNFWLCWALHASIMLFAGTAHTRTTNTALP